MTPQTVRTAGGRVLPAQVSFNPVSKPRKLLITVSYHDGDKQAAEELCSLIADLERVRNSAADVLVLGRADASEISQATLGKLRDKFDKATFQFCRRRGAKGYPYGANEMFYDLVTLMAQVAPWKNDYFAFVNLEPDCVPVHPGWINELIEEFRQAKVRNLAAVGDHQLTHATPHMNGVAVYDQNVWGIVGAGKLTGGSPQIPYDIWHGRNLLPVSLDTPYIAFEYQKPTITPEGLFTEHKGGVEPAIFHGVKDSSARAAVRAKHISFSDQNETVKRTVFTYFDGGMVGAQENQTLLRLWREGWASRGWNPVVLGLREASQNPRYAALGQLSWIGRARIRQFARWFALETVGGGLLTDYDVLPGAFTPASIARDRGIQSFAAQAEPSLSAAQFTRASAKDWTSAILGSEGVTDRAVFDAKMVDPVNEDRKPLVVLFGDEKWREAPLVHFSAKSVLTHGKGFRKAQIIEKYLQGVL